MTNRQRENSAARQESKAAHVALGLGSVLRDRTGLSPLARLELEGGESAIGREALGDNQLTSARFSKATF